MKQTVYTHNKSWMHIWLSCTSVECEILYNPIEWVYFLWHRIMWWIIKCNMQSWFYLIQLWYNKRFYKYMLIVLQHSLFTLWHCKINDFNSRFPVKKSIYKVSKLGVQNKLLAILVLDDKWSFWMFSVSAHNTI